MSQLYNVFKIKIIYIKRQCIFTQVRNITIKTRTKNVHRYAVSGKKDRQIIRLRERERETEEERERETESERDRETERERE